jgi:hypothetical protein
MYHEIIQFKYLDGHKIELVFEDGKRGTVDLAGYLEKGGVFCRFAEMEYFHSAFINKDLGILCWPDGVDIAPETLYSEATGEPLPAWMGTEADHFHNNRV